jgi:Cu2+-exporting ATPase
MIPVGVHPCPHCGTLTEGPEGTFCCHGCQAASELLSGVGLDDWYSRREQPAPRARRADDVAWEAVPVQAREDGTVVATLQVDGLRCASCVWVTESLLERSPGVHAAQVSYATGRTTLRYDPGSTTLGELTERIALLGYTPRQTTAPVHWDRDLLGRVGVAAFCAMNAMGLSAALYAGWLDQMAPEHEALFRWLVLLVVTPAATWASAPFFRGAWNSARVGVLHMDVPIALAIALSYAHGVYATLVGHETFLDSTAMLVALLLGGRLLEARGRQHAAEAAASLAAAMPSRARRVCPEGIEEVAAASLRPGDRVEVGLGAQIPADGVVDTGDGLLDVALLTGESAPQPVLRAGDAVRTGSVLLEGRLTVAVTRAADDSVLARMAAMVSDTPPPRAPSASDRLAPAFTAATLLLASLTAVVVYGWGGWEEAVARTIAVLVVACPCALALSEPLVGAAAIARASARGVLLRDAGAVTKLAEVDAVWLDKTGTITLGRPRIVRADDQAIRIAAALERSSLHPVASAILDEAARRGIAVPACDDAVEIAGEGVRGTVDGRVYRLARGGPGRLVLRHGDAAWLLHYDDRLREDVAAAVRALRTAGCEVRLLSGDDAAVVERVARNAGIDHATGNLDPTEKAVAITEAQDAGRTVLFVGDGVNDAAALSTAHVGLARASGAPTAVLAADGVLVAETLTAVAETVALSRRARTRMRRNLARSVAYNAVAIVAAMAGWINPLVAAVAMPLSSGMVIVSALRTR